MLQDYIASTFAIIHLCCNISHAGRHQPLRHQIYLYVDSGSRRDLMLELTVVRLISAELTQSGVFLHYRSAFNIPLSAHWRPCKCEPNGEARTRVCTTYMSQRSAVRCLCGGTDNH